MNRMRWEKFLGLCLTALALTCAGCRRAIRPPPPLSDALESQRLHKLSDEYWELLMRSNPVWATYLGDRRYDDQLQDLSPTQLDRLLREQRHLRDAVESLDPNKLAEADRITREALLSLLQNALDTEVCRQAWWDINPLDGVQASLAELPQLHLISEPAHARSLQVRYLRSAVLLDQHIDNLKRGLDKGYVAPRLAVERVSAQLEAMLAVRPEESPFITQVQLPEWRDEQLQQTRKELAEAVRSSLYPALERYRAFLANDYLPSARAEVGLSSNKNGEACYQARILSTTGLTTSASDIHQLGLEELAKNEAAMRRIARELTGSEDLQALKRQLQEQPAQRVRTPEELVAYNQRIVARAQRAAAKAFRRLPQQSVEVRPIDPYREKDAPAGYYHQGSRKERRPGTYFLNTYDTPQRLLFQMEALAFHETVPGHHVQIALAQELHLPRFRQELGQPAFKEGWAHYAELLADELNLYSSPEARFGMQSDQSLRAARLVVDTGLHALGWTRQQAIDFLLAHTAEPADSVVREVDRYILWPSQALGYKLGQLEILRLREEAKARLKDRFDLGAFHERLLANGAVPLPVARRVVEAWVEQVELAGANAPQPRKAMSR